MTYPGRFGLRARYGQRWLPQWKGSTQNRSLAGADLFAAACIRAAVLYPEWAGAVAGDGSATLDRLAQRLVAASLPLEGVTFGGPLGTPQA